METIALTAVTVCLAIWWTSLAYHWLHNENRAYYTITYSGPGLRDGMSTVQVAKILQANADLIISANELLNEHRATITVKVAEFQRTEPDAFEFQFEVIQRRCKLHYISNDASTILNDIFGPQGLINYTKKERKRARIHVE